MTIFLIFLLHSHLFCKHDVVTLLAPYQLLQISIFPLFLNSASQVFVGSKHTFVQHPGTYPWGFSKLVYWYGHPNSVSKKIFQVILVLMECFGFVFFNQIWSKGLKKMCDCTLKLHLVYIN